MAAALGRPLIAQTLVDIARIEQATAVAHGDRDSRVHRRIEVADPRARPGADGRQRRRASGG